jgi:hypothetical protein
MMATMESLIVRAGECSFCPGLPMVCIHHHALPELEGEGGTRGEAAVDLLRRLASEANSFPDAWHRSSLARVVTEIRAFIAAGLPGSRATPIS